MGKQWKQCQTLFFGAPKSLQRVIAAMKLKDAYSLEGKLSCTTSPGGSDGKASACSVGDLVQFLGQEDPLKKEMATHSSSLA